MLLRCCHGHGDFQLQLTNTNAVNPVIVYTAFVYLVGKICLPIIENIVTCFGALASKC